MREREREKESLKLHRGRDQQESSASCQWRRTIDQSARADDDGRSRCALGLPIVINRTRRGEPSTRIYTERRMQGLTVSASCTKLVRRDVTVARSCWKDVLVGKSGSFSLYSSRLRPVRGSRVPHPPSASAWDGNVTGNSSGSSITGT